MTATHGRIVMTEAERRTRILHKGSRPHIIRVVRSQESEFSGTPARPYHSWAYLGSGPAYARFIVQAPCWTLNSSTISSSGGQGIEEVAMARRLRTGKKIRPKTALKGKRYRCAICRKRCPKPIKMPAPWYCPNCLRTGGESPCLS
jgi:hypothetical protein